MEARYELTLQLAEEFLEAHSRRRCRFEAIGVAQGWSPGSYAKAVARLQKLGYERIALGGLVPLKSHEILAVLDGVSRVRHPDTKLHLFGVTRCEMLAEFRYFGVTSFDSTSPFRQAFKDDRDNYYVRDGAFVALRVPQVEGNAKLQARIRAGQVNQEQARKLEQGALAALRAFDREKWTWMPPFLRCSPTRRFTTVRGIAVSRIEKRSLPGRGRTATALFARTSEST